MHAMKNTTKAPEAREVKKQKALSAPVDAARKLLMAGTAIAAVCTGTGCASTPPRPKDLYTKKLFNTCFREKLDEMEMAGIKPGETRKATLLMHRMSKEYNWEQTPYNEELHVTDRVGEIHPIKFRLLDKPWGKMQAHRAWAMGSMYIDEDRVYAYINTVSEEDPGDNPYTKYYSVCMEVYAVDGTLGLPKVLPDFKSQSIMAHSTVILKAVDRYE